jgi:hypothetical protein
MGERKSNLDWTPKGICHECKHYRGGGKGCDAYPDGIPINILLGDFLHYKHFTFEDDHGILFEPKDEAVEKK